MGGGGGGGGGAQPPPQRISSDRPRAGAGQDKNRLLCAAPCHLWNCTCGSSEGDGDRDGARFGADGVAPTQLLVRIARGGRAARGADAPPHQRRRGVHARRRRRALQLPAPSSRRPQALQLRLAQLRQAPRVQRLALVAPELAHAAGRQAAEGDGADREPLQVAELEAGAAAQPSDLVVAALPNLEVDVGEPAAVGLQPDADGAARFGQLSPDRAIPP